MRMESISTAVDSRVSVRIDGDLNESFKVEEGILSFIKSVCKFYGENH